MDKKRGPYLALGFGLLLAVVVAVLAWSGRRTSGGIVLPESPADPPDMGGSQTAADAIDITPSTVGTAVATLSRPAVYSRIQTVETFWSGGSGQAVFQVYVSGGRTRMDTQLADGGVRHMLLAEGLAAVWYDDEAQWIVLRGAELTPDLAGRMLTYEDVVGLPAERIAAADYRERDGQRCIYVETAPDEAGRVDRYWVGVDTGLLYAAERMEAGELIYRFTAGDLDTASVPESLFLLPDGSALKNPTETE